MYIEQYLASQRHQERIKQAERERAVHRISRLRRLDRQQERAERQLLLVWKRVDAARAAMSVS